jgi:hypothetical protein
MNIRLRIVRIIPPVLSHFQAIIRIVISINDGIRFIRNEPIFCQRVFPGVKASSANKLINKMESIISIRGTQCRTADDFIFNRLNKSKILISDSISKLLVQDKLSE